MKLLVPKMKTIMVHHYPPIEYTLFVDMTESRWKVENISDVANHERIGQVVQLTCVAVLNALLEEIQPSALDRIREFAAEGLNIQVNPLLLHGATGCTAYIFRR